MNIRRKLTILLLISCAFPLIIFALVNFYFSQKSAIESATLENGNRVDIVQGKVDNLIYKNLYGVKILARNPIIRSNDAEKIKPVITEALKVYPDLFGISLSDIKGQQFVKSSNTAMTSIYDRDYFQAAVKGNEEVVSDILLSKSTGTLQINLASPVKDEDNGNITGVLQGTLEIAMLNDFVKELSTNNVTIYVLDRSGKMLANPIKQSENLEDREDLSNLEFVRDGLAGNSGSKEVMKDGQKKLVSYVQDKYTGWIICAEIPTNLAIQKSVRTSIDTLLIGIVILFITCGIVFYIGKRATRPIEILLGIANKVTQGDLTIAEIDIKSKDEIGNLSRTFENMVINLREVMTNIKEHSIKVSESSKEILVVCEQQAMAANDIAGNSGQIAEGTQAVSNNIDQISSNMNILDEAISDIEKKSNVVSSAISNAANYSEEGSEKLLKVNTSMNNIEKSVNDTSKVINKLGEHSRAIGNITEVIKGISEQTNLLALNAAIEAARAGEQGKGFAVVADEVRKLAEQSGTAADQVSELINGIQNETENVIQVMNKGIREVDDGSKVIVEANNYFDLIFKAIQETSTNMKDVNSSVENISKSGKEVFLNIKDMVKLSDKVSAETQGISAATEEQVAAIEEMTASAQNFSEMVVALEELTNRFKTN